MSAGPTSLEKMRAEKVVSIVKDGLTAFRDLTVVTVFVLLLAFPSVVNNRLADAGITKLSGPGFEVQIADSSKQTKSAGLVISDLQAKLSDYGQRLDELSDRTKDADIKSSIKQLWADVKASQTSAGVADSALKSSLLTQQQIMEQVAPARVEKSGWMFLGKTSQDKKEWAQGSPQTVLPVPADVSTGSTLKVRDDAYLREDAQPEYHASARVLLVVRSGDSVQVTQPPDYSPAKGGGWFVWVKVKRLG
jgi:hypothetical protein